MSPPLNGNDNNNNNNNNNNNEYHHYSNDAFTIFISFLLMSSKTMNFVFSSFYVCQR